jgi:hypothetical protein
VNSVNTANMGNEVTKEQRNRGTEDKQMAIIDQAYSATRLDTEAIKRAYDMAEVVEAALGRPKRRGAHPAWCCPFHDEDGPSFTVYRDHAHCFGCGWHGDVIKWTQERQGLGFHEACELLQGRATKVDTIKKESERNSDRENHIEAPVLPSLPQAPSEQWQQAALSILADCEGQLWEKRNPTSSAVRQYLEERGLSEATLQDSYIGYNPTERRVPRVDLWMPPGITIPLWHEPNPAVPGDNGTLYGVNVRLSKEARTKWKEQTGRDAKYLLAKGSKRAPVGLDTIRGKSHVFVLEGEFDALLTWQVIKALGDRAGHAGAFTMGGASSLDIDGWLMLHPELLEPVRYLISTDSDGPGRDAAHYWLEKTKRARLWLPPAPCKDITELWQKHGYEGVRWWVLEGLKHHQVH